MDIVQTFLDIQDDLGIDNDEHLSSKLDILLTICPWITQEEREEIMEACDSLFEY